MVADLLTAALAYAETGWPVFPLAPDKAPAFPSPHRDIAQRKACRGSCGRPGHGFYDATTDAELITAWWTARPGLLVAGRVPAGLFMLDVDPRGGGSETLAQVQAQHGPLPDTLTCLSGRGDGGRHLYFVRPPGMQLTDHRLPGVDLCHHGLRYGVLPPSPHQVTGQPYRWVDPTVQIAYPPAWLLRLLTPRERPAAPARMPAATPGVRGAGLAEWLDRQSSTPGSGRHGAALWALCQAFRDGGDPVVVDAVKAAAARLGKPDHEIESMAAWAADEYRSVL